ncbi:flavodoxin [Desulfosporosinus fructosivorans]|uniref:Flavodoxin n=1 Tax=Desulfosporosinus fructosivorans TaxID=2018669 RepID=A0A4Z0R7Y5_9FIRM|nr:flavodoxin domain-containing protein [Desulfosporosinus fructosivorans]TGE38920.1 flavodoxin [Desulfosporosinus fructosivorans]
MKTAIIFSSTHGTTEKASQLLREHLQGEVDVIDLKKCSNLSLSGYNSIILGSSIYAGSVKSKLKQFVKQNQIDLATKKLGLFLCCMYEGDKANKQFETAYPLELRKLSVSNGLFGGEFILSNLNFLERKIIKMIDGVTSDVTKLDLDGIKKFADKFNAYTA